MFITPLHSLSLPLPLTSERYVHTVKWIPKRSPNDIPNATIRIPDALLSPNTPTRQRLVAVKGIVWASFGHRLGIAAPAACLAADRLAAPGRWDGGADQALPERAAGTGAGSAWSRRGSGSGQR